MKWSKKKIGIAAAVVIVLAALASGLREAGTMPFGYGEWKDVSAEEAIATFEEEGFESIIRKEEETSSTDKVGKIKEVLVDGSGLYSKGQAFTLDKEIEIKYYVLKQFEPQIEVETEGEEGKPAFRIRTNLPGGTELKLTLTGDDGYSKQDEVTVHDGEAVSHKFTDENNLPLAEKYTLTITMDMEDQGATGKYELGENGECLVGPLVKDEDGRKSVYKEHEYTSSYTKAEVEKYKNQASMEDVKFALEMILAGGYGSNYSVKENDGVLMANVWSDGVAAGAVMAAAGNAETLQAWDTMTKGIAELSKSVQDMLRNYGYGYKRSVVNVVNDVNKDNVLFSASDGAVMYDCVYGIDVAGIGK